jgi:hypothetical protein
VSFDQLGELPSSWASFEQVGELLRDGVSAKSVYRMPGLKTLDLFNSRLDLNVGTTRPRVYNSLEDQPVYSSIRVASSSSPKGSAGKSTSKRLLFKKNLISQCEAVKVKNTQRQPARFTMFRDGDDDSSTAASQIINNNITKDDEPQILQPHGSTYNYNDNDNNEEEEQENDNEENYGSNLFSPTYRPVDEKLGADFYAPTLDKIRDRAHVAVGDTIAVRLKSKRLPGAYWSKHSRWVDDAKNSATQNVGPGYYEVYGKLSH